MTDARLPEPLTPEEERALRAATKAGRGYDGGGPRWNARLLATLDAARSGATPDGLREALTEWAAWFNEVLAANAEMPEDEWRSERASAAGEGLWSANRDLFAALAAATPPAAPDGLRSWTNDDQCCPGANVTVHAPDCPAAPESDSQKHSDAPDGLPTVEALDVERIRTAIHEHVGDDYPLLSLLVDLEAALRGHS